MTRQEIINQIGNYLNRTDLVTDGTALFWFQIAHKDFQRASNMLQAEEKTDYITLVESVDSYDVFSDLKEPIQAYVWDPDNNKVVRFYNKVNIETLRERRFSTDLDRLTVATVDSFDTFLYAIHANKFEVWPMIDSDLVGKYFGLDYYKWMTIPESESEDWITQHAFDYLLYRSLIESVSFLGLSSEQGRDWATKAETAMKRVIGQDISTRLSGPLRIRG